LNSGFITNNTNDFFDKEQDKIHQDLENDLDIYSFSSRDIVFHKSLDEFLSKVLLPQKNEFEEYLKGNQIKRDIEIYIFENDIRINSKQVLQIYNIKINDLWKSYLDERNNYNVDVTIFARTLENLHAVNVSDAVAREREIEKLAVDIKIDGIGNIYGIEDDI